VNVSGILDALYPSSCVACRSRGPALCSHCRPRGAERVRFSRAGLNVVAVGAYCGNFRRAILAFKRGRRDATTPLASLLAESLAAAGVAKETLIVPVPTTRSRALDRGFDQSVALARELALREGRPVLFALCKRSRDPQRGRSRVERLRAVNRFVVVAPSLGQNANVVLIDDVVTTGATLADCATALRGSGACVLGAFVLAHA
jgi:ComF family protein